MRAGSVAMYSSLGLPGAQLAVHGPRGGPALDIRLVCGAYGGRGLSVGVEECLARFVAEGRGDARRHRSGQLDRVRGARAEQPERGRDATEEPIAVDEPGRRRPIESSPPRPTRPM